MGPSDEALAFADALMVSLPLLRKTTDRYSLAYAIMDFWEANGRG